MRVARSHATCPWLEGGDATGPCAPAVAGPFCCKMFSPRLGWRWRLVRRAPNIHEIHTHPAAMRGVSSRVLASHPDGPSSRAQPGGSHGKAVAPERREGVCESCQTTPRRPGPQDTGRLSCALVLYINCISGHAHPRRRVRHATAEARSGQWL